MKRGLFYGATIGLSAFLLFLIEPMIAKIILPAFGGAASVWILCLVFFQGVLLAGYWYADITSRRLTARQQVGLHAGLLAVSLVLLPVLLPAGISLAQNHNTLDPALSILGVLAVSIGLPFFLLSATSSLVQNWYARRSGAIAPYRLFAISNLASFLALLAYPFLVEPRITTSKQLMGWSGLYGLFVGLCALTRFTAAKSSAPTTEKIACADPPAKSDKLLWLVLATCGSMMLLSVTNHLCQNIAPVPLLWILPLAVYLLSFVLVFHKHNFYPRWLVLRLLAVALGAVGYGISDITAVEAIQISIPLFCIALFIGCWFCHGELNRLRPEPEFLTSFYLMIAAGGAIGAILVGLIAPHIFRNIYELPLSLAAVAASAMVVTWRENWQSRALWAVLTVSMLVVLTMVVRGYEKDSLALARNFYGALRVTQTAAVGPQQRRTLYHGTIEHGAQFLQADKRDQPTTYYGPDSGVGLALRLCCDGPKRVGIVGLGIGTLSSYGNPGDMFRFYEINPLVTRIAQTLFTYLRDSKAKIEIAEGDARIVMEREAPAHYDVLVIDAFSGDAIPVHLLTKEACGVYLRHLNPTGILAFHVSNQYLQLAPVVRQLADIYDLRSRFVEVKGQADQLLATSDWVLVTRNDRFLRRPEVAAVSDLIPVPAQSRLWTDDYNNLLQVIRPFSLAPSATDKVLH